MEKARIEYFKDKLLKEKERVEKLIKQIKEFEGIDSDSELSSELSLYDNHPADTAQELIDKEKGAALQKNEIEILNSINDSLKSIEKGTYGKCNACGKKIDEERLEFIPYTQYCLDCKKEQVKSMPGDSKNEPPEEEVLYPPFGYGYNDFKDKVGFDAEDSYQSVDRFNSMEKVYDYGDYYEDEDIGFVEEIEKISNEEYKRQLPD
ncbi:general stress protein 16O [Clostridium homopropionicum DSM 5847]|uniref:General stress protein 16O n=1 Tax=Clostridium homopropionicum DSM 5847 TaxID=1121318 RepID=A0A0L6ZDD6_9CLOT|nr:TraR/DksA C4-type zinc finger protein [Clostridium homopropionicum]KOA20967.1 general stress protein 16O [Clostridium homopropionicum DSM 5847]SFG00855.1 transcriptional regulator, TraR/DksA family [Clostridium homopropionicum]